MHALPRWLVNHKLDLGELIDAVFSVVVPLTYILGIHGMKLVVFPTMKWFDFNILFPFFKNHDLVGDLPALHGDGLYR